MGFPLRQAILFGSFVRGEQHEWSDIDVALIADTFTGAGCVDIDPFAVLLRRYDDFELHTFPTAYFEDGDPFTEEIKRTGIVVA